MKKFVAICALAFAVSVQAQSNAGDAQGQAQGQQQGQKTIKDAAEYNAYVSATQMSDPGQKAAALESFVQSYPNSIVKEDALQQAMIAYQSLNNAPKFNSTADELLKVNPNNVIGLALVAYGKRQAATQPGANAPQLLGEASDLAKRGMQALPTRTKPEGVDDAAFQAQQKAFAAIFNGAIGHAALSNKDFPTAQKYLHAAVEGNPDNVSDVYPLALAYLTQKPPADDAQLNGLWFIARTINLAPTFADAVKTGQYYYKRYHGSVDGWDQLVAAAKTDKLPPANLAQTITKYVPPTPAEQITKMIEGKQPLDLGWGEWIFILTNGTPEQKDWVWNAIKDKPMKFQGNIVAADPQSVTMAVTEDGIQAKVPEVKITMLNPMKIPPVAGTDFQVQAVPTAYEAQPQFMVTLEQGQPIGTSITATGGGKAAKAGKGKAAPKGKAKAKKKR